MRPDRVVTKPFVLTMLAEFALCMSIGMLLAVVPVYADDDLGVVDRARGIGQEHELEIDPLGRPGRSAEDGHRQEAGSDQPSHRAVPLS